MPGGLWRQFERINQDYPDHGLLIAAALAGLYAGRNAAGAAADGGGRGSRDP